MEYMKTQRIKALTALLAELDPLGLIRIGAPRDEYSYEANCIASVEGAVTPDELRRVFVNAFSQASVRGVNFEELAERVNAL